MTIQEAIKTAANCLRLQAHPNYVRLALMNDGFTPQRADVILLWAKQFNEKETNERQTSEPIL